MTKPVSPFSFSPIPDLGFENPKVDTDVKFVFGKCTPDRPIPPPHAEDILLSLLEDPSTKSASVPVILPSTKSPIPVDHAAVKQLLGQAEKAAAENDETGTLGAYLQAIHCLNSAILDPKGLLLSVYCYIKLGQFLREKDRKFDFYIVEASKQLENLNVMLLDDRTQEKYEGIFIYLVGAAHLAIGRYGIDSTAHHGKAKNSFEKAGKLVEASSDMNDKYRIYMGLGLSFLYLARAEVINTGTKKRSQLFNHLKEAQTYIEKALSLHPTELLNYTLALTHSWFVLLLDEECEDEKSQTKKADLNKQSQQHLEKAIKALDLLPEIKTSHMAALSTCVKYKQNNLKDLDYARAYKLLSLAASTKSGAQDTSLSLSCGDYLRQMAWALPLDMIQGQAEMWLEKALKSSGNETLIAQSNLAIFYIQRALWHLIESNNERVNSKKHILPDIASPESEEKSKNLKNFCQNDPQLVEVLKKSILQDLMTAEFQRKKALEGLQNQSPENRKKNARLNLITIEALKEKALDNLKTVEILITNSSENLRILGAMKKNLLENQKAFETLRKSMLHSLRENGTDELKKGLDMLKSVLNSQLSSTYFAMIKKELRSCVSQLEGNFLYLTTACDTASELKTFNLHALDFGDRFNKIYAPTLFKWMLVERLRLFDLLSDLDHDSI